MKWNLQILAVGSLIGLLCRLSPVVAWRSFKVVFTTFPHQFNAEVVDVKVQLHNTTGDSEPALNVAFNFHVDVDDVRVKYVVAMESVELPGNYTTLLDHTLHLCQFLKQRNSDPAVRVFYENLLKHGNFFKECPIRKGAYTLRDYRIDEDLLPSYVPETNFYVDLDITSSAGKFLFKGRLNAKIDKSKGFDNLKMFSLG